MPGDSPPRAAFPVAGRATFTPFHQRTISNRGTGGGQKHHKKEKGVSLFGQRPELSGSPGRTRTANLVVNRDAAIVEIILILQNIFLSIRYLYIK